MLKLIIVEKDENGNITLSPERLEEMLKETYEIGKKENVSIPVIASGRAGTKEHFYDAFDQGKADAALAASLFHFKELEIMDLKRYLREKGISVRI